MIKLTEFTSVVDTYKKNFDIRSKRFSDKKKKDTVEKIDKRENRIETKKFLGGLKGAAGSLANKMKPGGDILDTVIRFGAFTLLGLIVKNIDKIAIAIKTIIEKLKEFVINAKKFFEEKVVPFLKDVYNLGKDIFNVFVGIGDFVIGMNPFKDFDSEFNIILRGILGLAAKLGELNAPKPPSPVPPSALTRSGARIPAKTSVKTPAKTPARQPRIITKIFSRAQTPVGATTGTGTASGVRKGSADLPKRTAPASGQMDDALRRMLARGSADTIEEVAEQFKALQDPKIRGPYSPLESKPATPTIPKPKELSSYQRFLGRGRQVLGSIEKGKVALGDFAKSLQSKMGNSADALKRIGSTKIPGIGLLDKVPMGARKFIGKSLRLLGLFLLAREVEQDLKNGDVNAAVVKLSAYGLGWLVTSAGLIAGSLLGVSGVGTVAGVAVLAGSIGAGVGTEALIRKSFLKTEPETPAKVKPKVPVVDDSLERLEFPEHFAPKPVPESSPEKIKPGMLVPGDYTPEELEQLKKIQRQYGSQSNVSKPSTVASVNRNISDGLDNPTTYGSQGMIKTREVVIALQRVEKEVLVPA